MRILNLDLDFFLDDIAHWRPDTNRLPVSGYSVWQETEVRAFLEDRCNLSIENKVPGTIVNHHDEAFDYWHDLIKTNALKTPFEVTHVDAHADLGLGDGGYVYLLTDLLHMEPNLRADNLDRNKVEFGNYLSFAIACRWLSNLTYVMHPKARSDLLHYHFKDLDTGSNIIRLRKLPREAVTVHGTLISKQFKDIPVLAFEPDVSFNAIPMEEFRFVGSFDYMVLSRSPGFTTPESDNLVPVIEEYMTGV